MAKDDPFNPAFIVAEDLDVNLFSPLENLTTSEPVHGEALPTSAYTSGDTSGKRKTIEIPELSLPPSNIIKRYSAKNLDSKSSAPEPPAPKFISNNQPLDTFYPEYKKILQKSEIRIASDIIQTAQPRRVVGNKAVVNLVPTDPQVVELMRLLGKPIPEEAVYAEKINRVKTDIVPPTVAQKSPYKPISLPVKPSERIAQRQKVRAEQKENASENNSKTVNIQNSSVNVINNGTVSKDKNIVNVLNVENSQSNSNETTNNETLIQNNLNDEKSIEVQNFYDSVNNLYSSTHDTTNKSESNISNAEINQNISHSAHENSENFSDNSVNHVNRIDSNIKQINIQEISNQLINVNNQNISTKIESLNQSSEIEKIEISQNKLSADEKKEDVKFERELALNNVFLNNQNINENITSIENQNSVKNQEAININSQNTSVNKKSEFVSNNNENSEVKNINTINNFENETFLSETNNSNNVNHEDNDYVNIENNQSKILEIKNNFQTKNENFNSEQTNNSEQTSNSVTNNSVTNYAENKHQIEKLSLDSLTINNSQETNLATNLAMNEINQEINQKAVTIQNFDNKTNEENVSHNLNVDNQYSVNEDKSFSENIEHRPITIQNFENSNNNLTLNKETHENRTENAELNTNTNVSNKVENNTYRSINTSNNAVANNNIKTKNPVTFRKVETTHNKSSNVTKTIVSRDIFSSRESYEIPQQSSQEVKAESLEPEYVYLKPNTTFSHLQPTTAQPTTAQTPAKSVSENSESKVQEKNSTEPQSEKTRSQLLKESLRNSRKDFKEINVSKSQIYETMISHAEKRIKKTISEKLPPRIAKIINGINSDNGMNINMNNSASFYQSDVAKELSEYTHNKNADPIVTEILKRKSNLNQVESYVRSLLSQHENEMQMKWKKHFEKTWNEFLNS